MSNRSILSGILVLACLACVGCGTRRTITITSQPAGALVHLNDQEVGRTPVTVPFTWYGVYDVRLDAAGYQSLWTEQKASAPLWDQPGLDLLSEAVPGAHVDLRWHFDLQPQGEADAPALLDRARQMRAAAGQE